MKRLISLSIVLLITISSGFSFTIYRSHFNSGSTTPNVSYTFRPGVPTITLRIYTYRTRVTSDTPSRAAILCVSDDHSYFYVKEVLAYKAGQYNYLDDVINPKLNYSLTMYFNCPKAGDFSYAWLSW